MYTTTFLLAVSVSFSAMQLEADAASIKLRRASAKSPKGSHLAPSISYTYPFVSSSPSAIPSASVQRFGGLVPALSPYVSLVIPALNDVVVRSVSQRSVGIEDLHQHEVRPPVSVATTTISVSPSTRVSPASDSRSAISPSPFAFSGLRRYVGLSSRSGHLDAVPVYAPGAGVPEWPRASSSAAIPSNPIHGTQTSPDVDVSQPPLSNKAKHGVPTPTKTKNQSKNEVIKNKDSKTEENSALGHTRTKSQAPSKRQGDYDTRPTPEPTGEASSSKTVHIIGVDDFALLMPGNLELISDAEEDGVAYCSPGSSREDCERYFPDGFILAADVKKSHDRSFIQVTGCIDSSKNPNLDPSDGGGQMDVRFPNGALCTFGGYGSSFIEQIEPSAGRFCLRCCASRGDQENCNSHHDKDGCLVAVPGRYNFPEQGVDCS
ncbi:hypothetical protein VKT23_012459 [Stygiomarasmius scandens]|uniref:Uncharacterized protein n=1 Tax=Marasmiellus scandens TaxID=2682957 RepID=A0ABR1J649_9AGAR